MIEIQLIDVRDDYILTYQAETLPRVGDYLSVDGVGFFKVDDVEHYVRKHGGVEQYISPHVKVMVSKADIEDQDFQA